MPLLNLLLLVIIISIFISLLFNPYVWLVVIGLSLYSWFKRKLLINKISNQQKTYQQNHQRKQNDDIIDVDYREVEED